MAEKTPIYQEKAHVNAIRRRIEDGWDQGGIKPDKVNFYLEILKRQPRINSRFPIVINFPKCIIKSG